MEYDYKVFKILLFLYWDLECYLENKAYVKNSLIVDIEDPVFLKIKSNNEFMSDLDFFEKVKYKEFNDFWSTINLDNIFKFEVYSKIHELDSIYKNDLNIKFYKLYENFFNMISDSEIDTLKEIQDNIIDPIYYQDYINE